MFLLFAYIVLAAVFGYIAIWFMKKMAPEHPVILDNLVWAVVVIFVVLLVANAIGVRDVPVPHLR